MQTTSQNALWRAIPFCAKILQELVRKAKPNADTLPPLTDHIARDIGLTPHEQALQRHHWPSRDTTHPFL